MKRLIVIPTYNEAMNVPILIPRLFKYIKNISILVVMMVHLMEQLRSVENSQRTTQTFSLRQEPRNPDLVVLIATASSGALSGVMRNLLKLMLICHIEYATWRRC